MNEYSIGLACGIIFGVLFLVIWFAFRKAKGIDPMEKFDERQIADRYKAYKSGFFALLIFVAADALLKMFGVSLFEEPVGECIAVFIAVGVFACRAVMSDAYFAPGKSMRNFILLYGVICFAQLLNTVRSFTDHELIRDGRLTIHCISPLCLILFLVIMIAVLIRARARAAKDYSQQQLADLVGVSRQTINAIEKGDYNPTIRLCLAICRALDRTLDELFWEDEA